MRDDRYPIACDDDTLDTIKTAMQRDDAEALALLDAAVSRHPADPRLALLRGSIHAAQGAYPQAFADLSQAVVMAPELYAARFMLGYLELCHRGAAQAIAVWHPLTELGEHEALGDFARGLTLLVAGQPEQARTFLQRGLDGNRDHPELSPFVQSLIEKSHEIAGEPAPVPGFGAVPPVPAADADSDSEGEDLGNGSHLLLGGYLDRRDH